MQSMIQVPLIEVTTVVLFVELTAKEDYWNSSVLRTIKVAGYVLMFQREPSMVADSQQEYWIKTREAGSYAIALGTT